jgi:hypothetical protein
MTLPLSGPLSIEDINVEFGLAADANTSMSQLYNGAGIVRGNNPNVPSSGTISIGDFYGASAQFTLQYTVVAGGGGGGGGLNDTTQAGFGGNTTNGSVVVNADGTFTVTVGAGGIGPVWSGVATAGGTSSLTGPSLSVSSQGGQGGQGAACCPKLTQPGQAGYTGGPKTSDISGSTVTYGTNGSTGGLNVPAQNGAPNTGNGGWGIWTQPFGKGGNGGSGVVLIRYDGGLTVSNPGGGLTFTTTTVGSDKLTTFTAGTGTVTFN